MAVDGQMAPTYRQLADHLIGRCPVGIPPHWVAIAGGPGSGKSTLAEAVAELINEANGSERAVVLPMDGFHYSRAELRALDPPEASEYLPRRGAPWTFDAAACFECFKAAKREGEATLPTYSRIKSDPVPGGVQLKKHHSIVLVEGVRLAHAKSQKAREHSLLLHPFFSHCVLRLTSLRPSCRSSAPQNYLLGAQGEEARWAPLAELWDEKWFIKCRDPAAQRSRLIARHLETWNEEKAAHWGTGQDGAAARADANDVLNMELIAPSERLADRVIESI